MKLSSKLIYTFFALTLLSSIFFASRSFATQDDKVTICHGTDSVTHPYTTPTVDVASATAEGHASHTGPIATSQTVAQDLKDDHIQWGDIIPPFPTSGVVGGLNWTTEGEAIYNNGCNYVTTEPTPTPTPTETVTPTPTPTPSGGDGSACQSNCAGSGGGDGSSNTPPSNTSNSSPTQAVLGASTMAGTGTFETSAMNLMLLVGMMVSGTGFLSYAKEKKA